MSWRLRCALCLVPWALCLDVASATTVIPATLDDIVAGSQLIVHGRVVEVQAQAAGDRRSIYTVVTVAVDEAIKGAPGRTVSFRTPGGQVGRYRRVVVGAPEFATGEQVIVFLRGGGAAIPSLFGLSQGVYKVTRAEAAQRFVAQVRTRARAGR
jgi:hypothetical protein